MIAKKSVGRTLRIYTVTVSKNLKFVTHQSVAVTEGGNPPKKAIEVK